jgi:polar amino acid transport system substrate-binding protein
MSAPQSMFFIIIPQTVRRILPTLMSEFILLFKDTALLAAVGVAEMTLRAREITATLYNQSAYIVAAGFYLLVTIPLGRLVAKLEQRLGESESGGGAAPPQEPLVPNPTDTDPSKAMSAPGGYYR